MFTVPMTLERLVQTADKSAYGSTGGTIYGLLVPIDNDKRVQSLQIGAQAYMWACSGDQDVQVADILTIQSQVYTVRGIKRYVLESIDFLDCLIELGVKN